MARIRTIKPQFFLNEELAALPAMTRLFFIGLWSQVDREGRCEDRPKRLKASLFPYEDADVEEMILELVAHGHLDRYSVDGVKILAVRNFLKHQRPHFKEDKSVLPEKPAESMNDHSCTTQVVMIESSKSLNETQEGKGREGKGTVQAAAPREVEVSKPRELTGVQKVIRGFKEAKGINANDSDWDAKHFKRFARPAADLLKIFDGDARRAIEYTLIRGKMLDDKQLTGWGLEAVARAAATDPLVTNLSGGDDDEALSAVDTSNVGRLGRYQRPASAGSLAGEALRAIEQSAGRTEGRGLDGPGMDEQFE